MLKLSGGVGTSSSHGSPRAILGWCLEEFFVQERDRQLQHGLVRVKPKLRQPRFLVTSLTKEERRSLTGDVPHWSGSHAYIYSYIFIYMLINASVWCLHTRLLFRFALLPSKK